MRFYFKKVEQLADIYDLPELVSETKQAMMALRVEMLGIFFFEKCFFKNNDNFVQRLLFFLTFFTFECFFITKKKQVIP